MNFLKKIFARNPQDYLSKGESLLGSHSPYEARVSFEEGLECCRKKNGNAELERLFAEKICEANNMLAVINIDEAEHAISRGANEKAVEHLELAKSLTAEINIREKADFLLAGLAEKTNNTVALSTVHSCGSCSQHSHDADVDAAHDDSDLSPREHYDLLIHQLPGEVYERYACLGEDFAKMYLAASRDDHLEALKLLEKWFDGTDCDIYCYEKGMILHRLGRVGESEECLREAIRQNNSNTLAHLGFALLLVDENRLDEAAIQLDYMIAADISAGQALMMRGDVYFMAGDTEASLRQFSALLGTPLGRAAAERLYQILMQCGRDAEAQYIFKQHLKCSH